MAASNTTSSMAASARDGSIRGIRRLFAVVVVAPAVPFRGPRAACGVRLRRPPPAIRDNRAPAADLGGLGVPRVAEEQLRVRADAGRAVHAGERRDERPAVRRLGPPA